MPIEVWAMQRGYGPAVNGPHRWRGLQTGFSRPGWVGAAADPLPFV